MTRAALERWEIVGSYEDAAISGSSTILRSGIQRLVRNAQRGEVYAELRGALFGILDFIKAEETSRPTGFMPAVEACSHNQILAIL